MERAWAIAGNKEEYASKFSVRINKKFPGMNQILSYAKAHRGSPAYARMKRECTAAVVSALNGVTPILNCNKIYPVFNWHILNRRRDPDNIAVAVKFIFDAFVIVGIIENDGHKHVGGWDNLFTKVSEPDYVTVDVYCQTEENYSGD